MNKLETFDNHLKELMQDPEFAKGYPDEKRRVGLAIKIADYRQKQGLSQTELAKLSGITQQQLSKLERGGNCNISTFLRVCNSLGIEVMLKRSAYA
ncbi:MAG: helix-turn-helix transcriptional regulator [FCB group bacterium]|jgi:DNA-binding XRE family transcriptional regulator